MNRSSFLKFILISLFLSSSWACSNPSNSVPPESAPLLSLSALGASEPDGLSGTISVYTLDGELVTEADLIFTAESIYSPTLTLTKSNVYRILLVFYYEDDLPIAFLDQNITIGAEDSYQITLDPENIVFSLTEVTDDDLLASFSSDTTSGILPDLDLDNDGYSNDSERRGGSNPRSAADVPVGPVISNYTISTSTDGNLTTVNATFTDGNRIISVVPSITGSPFLLGSDVFEDSLDGDELDTVRNYTLTFNPQNLSEGAHELILTATNNLDLVSTSAKDFNVTFNDTNLGPVITFNIEDGDIVNGTSFPLQVTATDSRDEVVSLTLTKPSGLTDLASDDPAYFNALWDTTTKVNGTAQIVAQSEDSAGNVSTSSITVEIANGTTDTSGPVLTLTVYPQETATTPIDYTSQNLYGTVRFVVVATDSSPVSYIGLNNATDLGCGPIDASCPLAASDIEDLSSNSSVYTNFLNTALLEDADAEPDTWVLSFLTTDTLGNSRTQSFSMNIKNAPQIESVTPSTLVANNSEGLRLDWVVEERTHNVVVLDALGNPVTCTTQSQATPNGFCEFTPTVSQAYTVNAYYNDHFSSHTTATIVTDWDADGVIDEDDNCKYTPNADQIIPTVNEKLNGIDDNCDDQIDVFDFSQTESFDFLRGDGGSNVLSIHGDDSDDKLASVFQNIGDFNGDGFDDFALSAPRDENEEVSAGSQKSDAGGIYIIYGPLDASLGFESVSTLSAFSIHGTMDYDEDFGDRLSNLAHGDFDGDGCEDLVMGAKQNSTHFTTSGQYDYGYSNSSESKNRNYRGRVTILWGCNDSFIDAVESDGDKKISVDDFKSGGLYDGLALNLYGHSGYIYLGASLDMANIDENVDVNEDGIIDENDIQQKELVIGAASGTGRMLLLRGSSDRCQAKCEFTVSYHDSHDTDYTVSNVYYSNQSSVPVTQKANILGVHLFGIDGGTKFGQNVKFVGDIDNDDILDLAVSSYAENNDGGAVYIYSTQKLKELFSSSNNLIKTIHNEEESHHNYHIIGNDAQDEHLGCYADASTSQGLASSISSGDFNSDGIDDLVLSAPYYGADDGGRVYIFFGGNLKSEMESFEADIILTPTDLDDFFGVSVASCDVNKDNVSDLIVGVRFYANEKGQVNIYSGLNLTNQTQADQEELLAQFFGESTSYGLGQYVTCEKGINENQNIMISSWLHDGYATNAGAVYFISNDYE